MLIKVKDEGDRWHMFDNAERVEYDKIPQSFESEEQIDQLRSLDGSIQTHFVLPGIDLKTIGNGTIIRASVIKFLRLQREHLIVFSTITYICNDEGKTVERIYGQ